MVATPVINILFVVFIPLALRACGSFRLLLNGIPKLIINNKDFNLYLSYYNRYLLTFTPILVNFTTHLLKQIHRGRQHRQPMSDAAHASTMVKDRHVEPVPEEQGCLKKPPHTHMQHLRNMENGF